MKSVVYIPLNKSLPFAHSLYLQHVVFKDGALKSGWVANGHWNFEIRKEECLAKHGNCIVNRWPLAPYITLYVKEFSYDYNNVIETETLYYSLNKEKLKPDKNGVLV